MLKKRRWAFVKFASSTIVTTLHNAVLKNACYKPHTNCTTLIRARTKIRTRLTNINWEYWVCLERHLTDQPTDWAVSCESVSSDVRRQEHKTVVTRHEPRRVGRSKRAS